MPSLTFIYRDGKKVTINTETGISIMRNATSQNVPGIIGECGGCASCATCHCYVDPDRFSQLPAARADEQMILDGLVHWRQNSRLTCQIRMVEELDGLVLEVPPVQG